MNKLLKKLVHRYCASSQDLVDAYELGMQAGKATARMTILAELVAIGSRGDFYEAPMKEFLNVFDPANDKKKP